MTLKNDATLHLSPRQLLKFGATAKRVRARFDVEAASVIPFAIFELGSPPREVRRSVHVQPSGSELDAYVADRVRISDSVVVEAGMRADSESYTPDGVMSALASTSHGAPRRGRPCARRGDCSVSRRQSTSCRSKMT